MLINGRYGKESPFLRCSCSQVSHDPANNPRTTHMRAILIKLSGSGFQGPGSRRGRKESVGEERAQANVKGRLALQYIEDMPINEFILKNKTLTKAKDCILTASNSTWFAFYCLLEKKVFLTRLILARDK